MRPVMIRIKPAVLLVAALLVFSGCNNSNLPLEPLRTKIDESKKVSDIYDAAGMDGHLNKTVYGTKDGVKEFLISFEDYDRKNKGILTSGYKHDYDTCYNITPEEIKIEKPECTIFKFSEDCLSVLLYKGELYILGGGEGVVDFDLADLNDDGEDELYFTYSWGYGMLRSQIAYFDFKKKTDCRIDYVYMDNDMMIIEDANGGLSLYHAYVFSDDDADTCFVEYSLKSGKLHGKLVYKDGNVKVE
jgi:hypothetical protein